MKTDRRETEFKRQRETFVSKGFPEISDLTPEAFRALVDPLAARLPAAPVNPDPENGKLPFVVVIPRTLVPVKRQVEVTALGARQGMVKLDPLVPEDFTDTVRVPDKKPYLLTDIDRGDAFRNRTPAAACLALARQHRLPLTIDEGVAILLTFPGFLMRNHCFSLAGSRHPGDKRVPAFWINAAGHPNLGWCWEGNPHAWLGMASCARRIV